MSKKNKKKSGQDQLKHLNGLVEGVDYIFVRHKAGRKYSTQQVTKYRKSCKVCGKDCGFKFKSLLDNPCQSCSRKKAFLTGRANVNHNFAGERKLISHKGVKYVTRSSYESFYIEYLIKNDINFLYEPKTFVFSDGSTYLPDFYLEKEGCYVELKGLMRSSDLEKINKFKEEFPEESLKILRHSDLKILGYKSSDYLKHIDFKIKGQKWSFKLLSERQYIKKNGDDSVGITFPAEREVHIREDHMSIKTIRHELAHVMFASCCGETTKMTSAQVEEIFCEIYANHSNDMMIWSLLIFKRMYTSILNRKGEYIKKLPVYREYLVDLKSEIAGLIRVIKEAKIKDTTWSHIDPSIYIKLGRLE